MRCTENTSGMPLPCSKDPSTVLYHWKQWKVRDFFISGGSKKTPKPLSINIVTRAALWPHYVDLGLRFPSFPREPFPPGLTLIPCYAERGCRRHIVTHGIEGTYQLLGALAPLELGFSQLPIRNGFIPVTPQKTLSCLGDSCWQRYHAKYPCRTAGFVRLSSTMKRR